MKKTLWIFLVLVMGLAGCASVEDESVDSDVVEEEVVEEVEAALAHEVSLEALFEKELVGSEFTVGRVLDENSAYTRYYITYLSGELEISGIMNVPKGEGPFPVLILNHGHIDTAVYTNGRGLKREQDYLARRGYVVIHPDYRNHAESDDDPENETKLRLGYTEDVINVVNAVRAADLPYVDGERVGMLGHSMGGGVTLNVLVVRPDLVDAAVLFAPVSADYRRNYEKWTSRNAEIAEKVGELYGTPEESPEFWDAISAKNYFDRVISPIQNHHGTSDESVPLEWSDELKAWLDEAGKPLEYFVYEGEPHEFIKEWPLVMERTVDFFDANLK